MQPELTNAVTDEIGGGTGTTAVSRSLDTHA
jgi:hypothetical protein